jgi:TRAP-type uncharacterized transport system fused permease subunit
VVALAAALVGFAGRPLHWWQRIVLVAAAMLLVFPTRGMELVGLLLAAASIAWARYRPA